jgi:hypothetical protein
LEERKEALRRTNDQLRMHANLRFEGGGKDAKVLVEQGYGPATAYEVDDDEFACYNGKNGGKFWMWYEPLEFQRQLQGMRVSVATCTERQCVDALRWTSHYVGESNEAYRAGLVPYAGPQCFPQLKDPVRLHANSQFVSKKKKKKTDKASAKGSKADGDVDELEDIAFQLQHCWLRCDKCGARRLVSSECLVVLVRATHHG